MQILAKRDLNKFNEVRLVGEGTNEIVSIQEAWGRAQDAELDLVLINDKGEPPVVKIEDYKKIQYEKTKKDKANKKRTAMKEVQFKVNISDHDLETKIRAIERFLEKKDRVKVTVHLRGREHQNPERAEELLEKVVARVNCKSTKIPGGRILEAV